MMHSLSLPSNQSLSLPCKIKKMDKFLETHNIPTLNHKEIENMNRSIMSKEIELVIKNLLPKAQEQMVLLVNSINHLKN